jgi:hypothetical protein
MNHRFLRSRSYDFLWLGIGLFPLLFIAAMLPVQPHDYWWYLRLGKDVFATGAVPIEDTFSSIQAGAPVVYQSWLSAVLFWLIYKAGEIPFTIFFVVLLIGFVYAMLWVMMRQSGVGPRLAALIALLAGLSGSNNWGVRPQLFTYALFIGILWILLKWQEREDKFLWLAAPIGLLWANLHGSFILLFILAGLAFVFGVGDKRKLALVALVTLAVTFINPRGYILWQNVIETFTSPGIRNLSPEWLPPLNEGWQMNIFFAWLILLVPLAAFARKHLTAYDWMLFLVFSWMALSGLRYVVWDLFIISILTARLMPKMVIDWFDQPPEVKAPAVNYGLSFTLLLLPLLLLPGIRESWWKGAPPALDPQTPVTAVNWLADHPELPGVMWNDVVFGSYLIHALPSRPVWIDTRIQVAYTTEQAKDYLFVQSARPGWDDFLEKKGVNLLILTHTQSALIAAVEDSSQWCEEYRDEYAFIFSRCETKQ